MPRCSFVLLLLAAATPLIVGGASAQTTPFSTIEVRPSLQYNVNQNALHTYWRPGYGGGLALRTPFYLGHAELGGAYQYYSNKVDVPRFYAVHAFAGWGVQGSMPGPLRWDATVRVGSMRMSFDEETFAGHRNESELTLSADVAVLVALGPGLAAHAGASYQKTFTAQRLELVFVSAGLVYAFAAPHWLTTLLQ